MGCGAQGNQPDNKSQPEATEKPPQKKEKESQVVPEPAKASQSKSEKPAVEAAKEGKHQSKEISDEPKEEEGKQANIGNIKHTPQVSHKAPDSEIAFPALDSATISKIYGEAKDKAPQAGSFIRKLIDCQNVARTNPAFITKLLKSKLEKEEIKTSPIAKKLNEAIEFVAKQSPVGLLKYSYMLEGVAKGHCQDLGTFGMISHQGSDGKGLEDRLKEKGIAFGQAGESLLTGKNLPEETLISLVLDGTPTKEQRKNLYNPEFTYCGAHYDCLLYTSPSPRDATLSRMPSSA
eukprot:TRINITY_DN18080_c0_g1_i2.p1 TRINITY_DN18080_c0_g1~~TRINITY_DN18080_c0_g1_i2.p1  ORF type:complete len:291 (-),score=93.84 TRINITY_DN18080_c0_g1_i2:12-884(-)